MSRVRQLTPRDRPRVESHLLSLSQQDRYMRFGYVPSDAQIDRFVARLDFNQCQLFALTGEQHALKGLAQLSFAFLDNGVPAAEFAVSVEKRHRRSGAGLQLWRHAVRRAQRMGVSRLTVYTLAENAAMQALIAKHRAHIIQVDGECVANIQLAPFRASDWLSCLLEDLGDFLANPWIDRLPRKGVVR